MIHPHIWACYLGQENPIIHAEIKLGLQVGRIGSRSYEIVRGADDDLVQAIFEGSNMA